MPKLESVIIEFMNKSMPEVNTSELACDNIGDLLYKCYFLLDEERQEELQHLLHAYNRDGFNTDFEMPEDDGDPNPPLIDELNILN